MGAVGNAHDIRWMDLALGLAARGLGRVWPNPAVGCVLVRDGHVIGRGWTQPGGRPHAETEALARAGDARFATAYVTLEPCSHHGKTPPCAEALIAAGIERAVVAVEDPDPRVSGRGTSALRAAGIAVDVGLRAAEAWALNRGFFQRLSQGRPKLTLKLASTLDGRIATARGESRWITGPAARRQVHMMRARHDAVMIGAGTARADDPMLDIRDMGLQDAAPVRVVVDGGLSLPLTGRLARSAKEQPLWLVHRAGLDRGRLGVWQDLGAELIEAPVDPTGAFDLPAVMSALGARGLTRVLCEGGGHLAAGLMQADLVDDLVAFTAGKALGAEAVPGIAALGVERLDHAPLFSLMEVRQVGGDTVSLWTRAER